MGRIFNLILLSLVFAGVHSSGENLRMLPAPAEFDFDQSSIVGPWARAAGYKTPEDLKLALQFRQPESVDVLKQGQILALHAINRLAYYYPAQAEKMMEYFGWSMPREYTGNMFPYAIDAAVLHVFNLYKSRFNFDDTPELRRFILSLFREDFMSQSLESFWATHAALRQAQKTLKLTQWSYPMIRTYAEAMEALDRAVNNMQEYTINTHGWIRGDKLVPQWGPISTTYKARKLKVDISKLSCFHYRSTTYTDDEIAAQFNKGLKMQGVLGTDLLNPSLMTKAHYDFRNESYSSDHGDPFNAGYQTANALEYTLVSEFIASGVRFPLAPPTTAADASVLGGSPENWTVLICLQKTNVGKRNEGWITRYVIAPIAPLANIDTDSVRDTVLKRVLADTEERILNLERDKLSDLSAEPSQSPRAAEIQSEILRLQAFDSVRYSAVKPAIVHAKRAKPRTAAKTAGHDFNAIGYELDVPVLHVESKPAGDWW